MKTSCLFFTINSYDIATKSYLDYIVNAYDFA